MGILADGFGAGFFLLAEYANKSGRVIDGKPPLRPTQASKIARERLRIRSFLDRKFRKNKIAFAESIAFDLYIERIPSKKIIIGIGIALTLYGYTKSIILCYRQGKRFSSKFRQRQKHKLLLKQAKFLKDSLLQSKSVKLIFRVKRLANSNNLVLC